MSHGHVHCHFKCLANQQAFGDAMLEEVEDPNRITIVSWLDSNQVVLIIGYWLVSIAALLFGQFVPLLASIAILPITLPAFIYFAKRTIWANDEGLMINNWRHPRFLLWSEIARIIWTDATIGKKLTLELISGELVKLSQLRGPDPTDEVLANAYDIMNSLLEKSRSLEPPKAGE